MLQVVESDEQTGGLGRPILLGVERTELDVKDCAINLIGKPIQRMLPIENLVET